MLKNTFCHAPGIGPHLESRLWSRGFLSWGTVLERCPRGLTPSVRSSLLAHLRKSVDELDGENASFFEGCLPPNEQWRMFPDFRRRAGYLDIETTGLRPEFSTITTIALYDGRRVRTYVWGRNLDDFVDDVRKYKLLITYNGKCFDIPFIEKFFDIKLTAAHIDLRYVLRSLGYTGGLKRCEKKLGINRGALDGVDGYFAVLLWADFVDSGNERALETLLAYNTEDVVNLETLMVIAYNLKIKGTPFALSHAFGLPSPPSLPFQADRDTIERIRRKYFSP